MASFVRRSIIAFDIKSDPMVGRPIRLSKDVVFGAF